MMNGDRMMIQDLARRVRALEERLAPSDADPPAPTLREQVALALYEGEEDAETADAVLAVVADWLEAQPLASTSGGPGHQRDHDVRLVRGGAS